MKTLVIIGNVLMLAFTCLVTATDGFPDRVLYLLFWLMLLGVPAFTVLVLRRKKTDGSATAGLERVAFLANIALLAAVAWALVDQYPHPEEEGFFPYVAVILLVPILSAVILFRRRMAAA